MFFLVYGVYYTRRGPPDDRVVYAYQTTPFKSLVSTNRVNRRGLPLLYSINVNITYQRRQTNEVLNDINGFDNRQIHILLYCYNSIIYTRKTRFLFGNIKQQIRIIFDHNTKITR